ncbi:MAG: hypothetical protein R3282_01055 [Rhodothermales bacterium]|nr:hypothetical protein [Rhodothermales bacterium]
MISQRVITAFIAVIAFSQLSCETFDDPLVDPFEGQQRYFTIYGFLDSSRFDQRIRVIPVTRTPENIASAAEPAAFIDAEVSTTDLETGQRIVWRHTLSQLSDGRLAHVYEASMRVEPGHPYRIDVIRSDSAMSTATTIVPSLSTSIAPVIEAPVMSSGEAFQTVRLTGVPRAFDIEIHYKVAGPINDARVTRTYGTAGAPDDQGRWTLNVDLSRDAAAVLQEVESELGILVWLEEIGVSVKWVDDQWPNIEPPIVIDRLAQPGVLSNVENGDGFFGSVGTYSRFWEIDNELEQLLGFQ